jgi:hypothetical protein
MLKQTRTTLILRLNLILISGEGLLVLGAYLKQPSEPGSAIFLGFSYVRLALLLIIVLLLFAALAALLISFRNPAQASVSENFLIKLASKNGIGGLTIVGMAISYVVLFLSKQQLGSLAAYRERLYPIILWMTALSVQFGFTLLLFRGINQRALHEHRRILIPSFVTLSLAGLLLLIILSTRLGLEPDRVYWQTPGVPVLFHQVLLAAFAGILFYLLAERAHLGSPARFDWIVFAGLWGLACLLWLRQSADLTWFTLKPTPPNYQNYPFSDALVYDNAAREYLIGKPIPSDFWWKPLYSFFLTGLHVLAGGNYTLLVSLQVIFLAVIPAFAYLLMVPLGSRSAGLTLALLLILRERNALLLSNVIQVSHVKLLLSDVFAMGFMVLLLWLFFHWAEKPGERRVAPLVLGGVFSLLVLTRGHPIILLPFILCAVLLAPFPRPHLRWEAVAFTFLGFMLPLLPWLWRNYQLTGKLAFQYPASPYSIQMSSLYSFTPGVLDPENRPPQYPGESDAAYYGRLQKQVITFTVDHPDEVAKFISAHYFHNLVSSYVYLPYSFQIENIKDYTKAEPFWGKGREELSTQGYVLFFINLTLMALGFGYLWKKYKHLALVPLLLGGAYNLSVSIGRVSGWRFILPADWITLIYYAAGLMQLYHLLRSLVNREVNPAPREDQVSKSVQPVKRLPLIGFTLFLLLIGTALTKGQELFSNRYPNRSAGQLLEEYNRVTRAIPSGVPNTTVDDFLKTEGAVIVYGQAHNPSFFKADKEGLDDSNSWSVYYFWPSYKPRSFSRVIFNLSGPTSTGVVLPMTSPPSVFPDGADVIVVGCLAGSGEIDAFSVLIRSSSPILYSSKHFPTCPLTMP